MVREVFLEYRVLFFLNIEPGGTLEHHEILDCLGVQGASAIVTDISGRVEKPLYTAPVAEIERTSLASLASAGKSC
jgi:hypothetical protein